MNLIILFMTGLIFLTSLYELSQTYVSSWILIIGLVFSSITIGYIFGGESC